MENLKNIRSGNRSAVTRIFRKFCEAKETTDFDSDELLATYDNPTPKKKLFEKLNEQILDATDSDDVESETVGTDEYSNNFDTKLRHFCNCTQIGQNPTPSFNVTQSSYQVVNLESPPFRPANVDNFQNTTPFYASSGAQQHTSYKISDSSRIAPQNIGSNHRESKLSLPKMPTYSFATVIVAFVVSAYGHDCTKYSLTPSDQSLIDMMKHYLLTSRKADCPLTPSQHGQAGGNYYTNKGGGSNYLCLPSDPENGKAYSYANDGLYGSEYEIHSSTKPSGLPVSLAEKEVPCAVCRRKEKVSVLMIAGRKSCYKGWKSEYSGFLMSAHKSHNTADYICMDGEAEPLDNRSSNEEGALLYPVKAKCGSLRCPPYKDNTEVLCTVCTK
ncbi:unnamed protein product [Mytilus coruscus]|uniref:Uncharacterized protein n=1 Tax=Mytilus coruscus TaxID=42192 RepID=A0A6J8DA61_MYTCO|nr:unnamed protein product [Mytilus coruscus]